MSIWIGTSGYNYPEWKGSFYPETLPAAKMLPYYAERFPTVEINYTFYRTPNEKILEGWSAATPEHFKLTLKAPKRITHDARLRDCGDRVRQFMETAAILGPKLGALLFQLPPNLKKDVALLDAFLDTFPPKVCAAFEFRHASWFHDDVYALLRDRGAALVIGDDPRRPFQTRELTAEFTFVRFHAGVEGGNGNYSYAELERWARWIEGARESVDVYAYFNNDWEGYAIYNGLWLKRRLGLEAPPHPAEPPEQR